MDFEVHADAESAAKRAAEVIAEEARKAVQQRGRFLLAVSGGRTPWMMLRMLAKQDLPWRQLEIIQVDERVAPEGHPDRNLTHLQEALLERAPLAPSQIHPMPVNALDLNAAAAEYSATLRELAGRPPVLDLVHLGLGADGHTASLVPGDPVLDVQDADIGVTGPYQMRRRMTLTFPVLNRARRLLWVVTGSEKAEMLARLRAGDRSIPAGQVNSERSLILADRAAANQLDRFHGAIEGRA
jgi:6-phosphogluconolactonase